jgi:hypothetical protein
MITKILTIMMLYGHIVNMQNSILGYEAELEMFAGG